MDDKRILPYDIDLNDDINTMTSTLAPGRATAPMKRAQFDQGTAATVISGTDGDRKALIGTLELMECATHGNLTVSDVIAWFDEYLVKPGYMRKPTRVFENGVGTVYLGDARNQRHSQDLTLRRIIEMARKEVCTVLAGLLENPPDDRFIKFNIVTKRIYRSQDDDRARWCIRARSDDRLSGIMLSLLAADILSNPQTYYQRLSICSECGRISFRLDTTNRRRCPAHDLTSPKALDEST